jgi:hypothetical protein
MGTMGGRAAAPVRDASDTGIAPKSKFARRPPPAAFAGPPAAPVHAAALVPDNSSRADVRGAGSEAERGVPGLDALPVNVNIDTPSGEAP